MIVSVVQIILILIAMVLFILQSKYEISQSKKLDPNWLS